MIKPNRISPFGLFLSVRMNDTRRRSHILFQYTRVNFRNQAYQWKPNPLKKKLIAIQHDSMSFSIARKQKSITELLYSFDLNHLKCST